jgi:hypothetical protein
MGTVVRLYLGWRLLRIARPLLAAAASSSEPHCSPSALAT